MSKLNIMGIDPGQKGGLAIWKDGKVEAYKMPETPTDLLELLASLSFHEPFCYIEDVHSMPTDGKKAITTFMKHVGHLEMGLMAADIPNEQVSPGTWQGYFKLKRKCKSETTTQKKNRHKAKAQKLFPDMKITHAIADALLIMEWGRRKRHEEL